MWACENLQTHRKESEACKLKAQVFEASTPDKIHYQSYSTVKIPSKAAGKCTS